MYLGNAKSRFVCLSGARCYWEDAWTWDRSSEVCCCEERGAVDWLDCFQRCPLNSSLEGIFSILLQDFIPNFKIQPLNIGQGTFYSLPLETVLGVSCVCCTWTQCVRARAFVGSARWCQTVFGHEEKNRRSMSTTIQSEVIFSHNKDARYEFTHRSWSSI